MAVACMYIRRLWRNKYCILCSRWLGRSLRDRIAVFASALLSARQPSLNARHCRMFPACQPVEEHLLRPRGVQDDPVLHLKVTAWLGVGACQLCNDTTRSDCCCQASVVCSAFARVGGLNTPAPAKAASPQRTLGSSINSTTLRAKAWPATLADVALQASHLSGQRAGCQEQNRVRLPPTKSTLSQCHTKH